MVDLMVEYLAVVLVVATVFLLVVLRDDLMVDW